MGLRLDFLLAVFSYLGPVCFVVVCSCFYSLHVPPQGGIAIRHVGWLVDVFVLSLV